MFPFQLVVDSEDGAAIDRQLAKTEEEKEGLLDGAPIALQALSPRSAHRGALL